MKPKPDALPAGEKEPALRLPIVALSAEHLVMGHLLRRNILTYKAPPGNEGYDLICIHPNPRHAPLADKAPQIRVQVKSRYQTDCDRAFPLKEVSFDAFDFLVIVFLNIGKFYGRNDGSDGAIAPEFFTLSSLKVRTYHRQTGDWQKVHLRGLDAELADFKDEKGFEQIARALGVQRPRKLRTGSVLPGS
ncbi:MAG: hypothetical protein WDO74_04985 [Pseudomonadota bacterium]